MECTDASTELWIIQTDSVHLNEFCGKSRRRLITYFMRIKMYGIIGKTIGALTCM